MSTVGRHEICAMNVINVIIFELTLLLLVQAIVTDGEGRVGGEKTVTASPRSQRNGD